MVDIPGTGRRQFLKGSLALGTVAAATPALSRSAETGPKTASPTPPTAAQAHAETAPVPIEPGGSKAAGAPGSDYMVDLLSGTGIRYVAAIPGSAFRGLHESTVNYGHNKAP